MEEMKLKTLRTQRELNTTRNCVGTREELRKMKEHRQRRWHEGMKEKGTRNKSDNLKPFDTVGCHYVVLT